MLCHPERIDARATVTGFDPTGWKQVRFRLWAKLPALPQEAQIYRVGHVALP